MNIKKIVTQGKINGADGVQAAIDNLSGIVNEHEMAVIGAIDAYYADMTEREDAIKRHLDSLAAHQRQIDSDITAASSALAQAAVYPDNTQIEKIQTRLSGLEAQKQALSIQIERLSVSQFPRNTELFQNVVTCRRNQVSALEEVSEALDEIAENVRTQIHSLETALTRIASCSIRDTLMRRFDNVRDDYYCKETTVERLAKRQKEEVEKTIHATNAERTVAMLAEIEHRNDEKKSVMAEFQTIQQGGYTIRSQLNHETGKYEEIDRTPNRI